MENYSLSDLAAVTNDGFGGGGSAWWIIILFLFAFMNGGIGNNKGFLTMQQPLHRMKFYQDRNLMHSEQR